MMKNVRQSRKVHPTGRRFDNKDRVTPDEIRGQEYRDGSVLRDRASEFDYHSPAFPKQWPDPSEANFPLTKPPKPSSQGVEGNGEAKKHAKSISATARTSAKR